MRKHLRLMPIILLAAANVSWGAAITTETFSVDEAGFSANTIAGVLVHSNAGGNPGGHIQVRRDLGAPFFDIGAVTQDSRFTGDYGTDNIRGFRVDLRFDTDNFNAAYFRVRIDSSTNGWLIPLTNNFATGAWNTYAVAFDPTWSDLDAVAAGWLTDQDIDPNAIASPSFATVMASVGFAEVRLGNSSQTSSLAGIDNFGLTTVPEPSTVALLGIGLGLLAMKRLRRP